MKYASLFTGGGLADWGARAAGLTPVWGVEYDAQIVAVAQQNDPSGTIYHASVCDVDYTALERVDVLHASPPCPNFSVAKTGGVETAQDLVLADAVCRAIRAQLPALFTLENVRGYAQSQSLARIQATLLDLDYHVTTVVINAADYGVPQTRERLFLFAHAGGWMQSQRPLPRKQPWKGWYQAIEDLIPTLPDSAFAPWQLARLPEELQETVLIMTGNSSFAGAANERGLRYTSQQAATCTAELTGGMPRAFLMRGANSQQEWGDGLPQPIAPAYAVTTDSPPRAFLMGDGDTWRPVRSELEPSSTLSAHNGARAFLVNEDSKMGIVTEGEPAFTQVSSAPALNSRAWLSQGRVVSMTPRALARFMGGSDEYILPEKKSLACRIIGNGVCPPMYAAILRSQLD